MNKLTFLVSVFLLSASLGTFQAAAEQPFWKTQPALGNARLSVLFWDIYDAWYFRSQNEQALKLTYLRDFSKRALVKETASQWQRMSLLHPLNNVWLAQLENMWPDIDKGDTLVCHLNPQGQSVFYHNGKRIGQVDDPDFGPQFLSIWIGPEAEYQSIRKQLLNLSP
ncbi:chalcone isomerase family protein [Gayadomonas joobiniege]|uniref:chalcone isomerase family protein n=1 Tax=Gayadomonas joobiniege TaxID=1234606 RepID=UPI00036BD1CB|nr:chalcone isomerase family protein [Gayadomonas joobiniege]